MANGTLRRLMALGISGASAAIIPLNSFADSLNLTTWYPAPYGVYSQLRSTGNSYFAYQGGNVGIGTTSPQSRLHVTGGNIRADATGTNADIIDAVHHTGFGLIRLFESPTGDGRIMIRDNASADRIWLDAGGNSYFNGGNVGIGTTNPGFPLSIAGGNGTSLKMSLSNLTPTTGHMWTLNSGSIGNFYVGDDTAGANRLVIDTSGNVGIGTISPQAPLHVVSDAGEILIEGKYPLLRFKDNDAVSGLRQFQLQVSNGGLVLGANNDDWSWKQSNYAMVIQNNGIVGIGTASPAARLQVGNSGDGTVALANAWNTFSSRRFKENVRPIGGALDKINRLRGVEFRWKGSGKRDMGVVAEEVGRVFPEIVQYENNGQDARGLDYSKLVAPLIEAVKEQQRQIKTQSDRIEALEKTLAEVRKK